MKFFTKNLIYFALTLTILTIIFRIGLKASLENKMYTLIWIVSAVYAGTIFIAGWFFGKRDYLSIPLFDLGFRFHLTTFVICNLLAELYFRFGFHAAQENIKSQHLALFIWAGFIVIHFIVFIVLRKHAIKGLHKSDIFE